MFARLRFQTFIVLVVATSLSLCASSTDAATLSGTIHYTGSQGPVSASRPIKLILSNDSSFHGNGVDQTIATTNPGDFTLNAPSAGDYYLVVILDVVPDSGKNNVNVGEPFQLFDGRFNFPADPLLLPRSGLAVTFNDTGRLPGVAGTVTYSGTLGQVDSTHKLIVQRFVDPALTQPPDRNQEIELDSNGGRYDFIGDLDTNTYYLMAFFDVNGNLQYNLGEPFQIYNGKSAAPGNPVVAGPDQDAVDFELGDPTTAACVGDCDGSGKVTANEIIALVNLALGSQTQLSACPHGIPPSGDVGQVDVTLIIQAVNNALSSCPTG